MDAIGAHTVFVLDAAVTLAGFLWLWRYVAASAALAFAAKGGHDLLLLPREGWRFPLLQARTLLLLHFACAALFGILVTAQKCFILSIADGSAPTANAPGRTRGGIDGHHVHRVLGRIALLAAGGASLTALLLAPSALHGSGLMFVPWAALWLVSVCFTLYHARRGNWMAHAAWANYCASSALIFLLGRIFIALLSPFVPDETIYFASAAGAAGIAVVNFFSLALRWRSAEHRHSNHRKMKAVLHGVKFMNRSARAARSKQSAD